MYEIQLCNPFSVNWKIPSQVDVVWQGLREKESKNSAKKKKKKLKIGYIKR